MRRHSAVVLLAAALGIAALAGVWWGVRDAPASAPEVPRTRDDGPAPPGMATAPGVRPAGRPGQAVGTRPEVSAFAELSDEDRALLENALKPEFWKGMSPEEKGRTVRRLAEIYPWPGGRRPFREPQ